MNASQTTLHHLEQARASLAAILEQIQEDERQAADGQSTWGHAGSAGKVAEDLADLASFYCPTVPQP